MNGRNPNPDEWTYGIKTTERAELRTGYVFGGGA